MILRGGRREKSRIKGYGGFEDWRIGGLEDWRIGGLRDLRIGGLKNWRKYPSSVDK